MESMKQQPLSRHGVRVVLLIFFCALAVRFVFLVEFSHSPFFDYYGIDSDEYREMAVALLAGEWPGPVPFARPPLYTVFLALLLKVAGGGLFALRLFHAALGAMNCALLYLVARRLFGGRFVPLAAAGICCFHGTLVYFDAQLLPTALESFLLLLALLALLHSGRRDRPTWWLAPGLCIALAAVNRGTSLLFLPCAAFWAWSVLRLRWPVGAEPARPGAPGSRALAAAAVGALLLPFVLIVVPISLHNARYDVPAWAPAQAARKAAGGRFVFLASNGGLNFYLGNHWRLRAINDPNHPLCFATYDFVQYAPLRERRIFSTAEAERFLVRRTLREIREEPGDYLELLALKAAQLLNGAEIARNSNLYAYRHDSLLLAALLWKAGIAFPGGLLIPLAIVGAALDRRRWRERFLPLSLLAALSAMMLVFFVTARYRAPMIFVLAIYAARAAELLLARRREAGWRALRAPLAGLLVALVVCNLPIVAVHAEHGAYERVNLGLLRAKSGRMGEALEQFEAAARIAPVSPQAGNALALARAGQGRMNEALRLYAETLRRYPDDAETHNELALALIGLNRFAEAEAHLRQALRRRPEMAEVQANLGALLARQGRADEGVRELREALAYDPCCTLAYSNLAAVHEYAGRIEEAIATYQAWLRVAPHDPQARSRLEAARRRMRPGAPASRP